MPASEIEIHAIVRRLLREGYTALIAAQRRVVDTLTPVCGLFGGPTGPFAIRLGPFGPDAPVPIA